MGYVRDYCEMCGETCYFSDNAEKKLCRSCAAENDETSFAIEPGEDAAMRNAQRDEYYEQKRMRERGE